MIVTPNRAVIGLFAILLLGAIVFYLERILFLDASFILFRIVNMDMLQIQEYRYGSFITQGVPWIAAKLHLPLNVIVLLYSISFNLFYFIVAGLLVFKFRETALGILMAFYYTLFVSDTYFWTNNEVHQGIAWMFLFFGTMLMLGKKKISTWSVLPIFCILSFLAIFTHPLVAFPCWFLWFFFGSRKDWPYGRIWSVAFTIILIVITYKKFTLSTDNAVSFYDSEKLKEATDISFRKVIDTFTSPMAKEVIKRSLWNYWIIPLLFVAGAISAFRLKKYWHLMLTAGFCLAYFVVVCITFNTFLPFYTESEWMPVTIIATALFVYYTFPALKPKLAVTLLAGIFLIRLGYISFSAQKFVDRKNWNMATLQKMREQGITKGIVYENEENTKTLLMNWGSPTESMIASALAGDKPQLTFVVGTPENISQRMSEHPDRMISCFDIMAHAYLNKRYFNFDSTSTYQVVSP